RRRARAHRGALRADGRLAGGDGGCGSRGLTGATGPALLAGEGVADGLVDLGRRREADDRPGLVAGRDDERGRRLENLDAAGDRAVAGDLRDRDGLDDHLAVAAGGRGDGAPDGAVVAG